MFLRIVPTLSLLLLIFGCVPVFAEKKQATQIPLRIESKDPAFEKLVPRETNLEILTRGLGWGEGIGWDKKNQCLFFTDVRRGKVGRYKGNQISYLKFPSTATPDTFHADGLILGKTGHLILCGHSSRRVMRLENNLSLTVLAEKFDGKKLNSPNDVILDSEGTLFFTDPPYGLNEDKGQKSELGFSGVFRLSKTGALTLLTPDLVWPNGIALSPDEKTLYVSVSDEQRPAVVAYDLKDDGTVARGRVFFDFAPFANAKQGLPNGVKVDRSGNVFVCGPGGIFVLDPKGKLLGKILIADYTTNCAFGEDGSTLYVTTAHMLCRFKTKTTGY
jgi:gluconolactonase